MTAYFRQGLAITLTGRTVNVVAQLCYSATPDDTFILIPEAEMTLQPAPTGNVAIGTIVTGAINGLNIPLTQQTHLMMVFSALISSGTAIASVLTGHSSTGVTIE